MLRKRKKQPINEYIVFDLEKQVRLLVEGNGFEIINYLKENAAHKDLINRSFYLSEINPSQRGNNLYLNLMLNVDGVRIRHSRSGEAWPVSALVVELPPRKRYLYIDSLLLGIWIGAHKPDLNIFLKQIVQNIEQCKRGFTVDIGHVNYTVRCNVMLTVMDMPARASFWNVRQFNGQFGCMECRNLGMTKPDNKLHRFYPHGKTAEKSATFYTRAWKYASDK